MTNTILDHRSIPDSIFTSLAGSLPAPIVPLIGVLEQLSDLLEAMSDEQYRTRPVGPVSSNVGGHVRHCLDHIEALLSGVESGLIDYDQRQRGTDIETSRISARAAIGWLQRRLRSFPLDSEERGLSLSAIVQPGSPSVEVETSVGRELVFVLSHTIHHNALIAVMAKTLGVPLPEHFGYAPSTLDHMEKAKCVR